MDRGAHRLVDRRTVVALREHDAWNRGDQNERSKEMKALPAGLMAMAFSPEVDHDDTSCGSGSGLNAFVNTRLLPRHGQPLGEVTAVRLQPHEVESRVHRGPRGVAQIPAPRVCT